jgi:hypothetical protein
LILVNCFADGEHHLLVVTMEGRNPAQARGYQILTGNDRFDPRQRERGRLVNAVDPRVRVRTVDQRQEQRSRQNDVINVAARTANEARILLALHRFADCVPFLVRGFRRHDHADRS